MNHNKVPIDMIDQSNLQVNNKDSRPIKIKDYYNSLNEDDMEIPVTPKDISNTEDSNYLKRPDDLIESRKLNESVKLDDTTSEGRPSIYLFIFVNPLSGDQKGSDLVNLPIQHFRLRKYPQVQVEIHNILNDTDRQNGVKNVQLVETKLKMGEIPPIQQEQDTESPASESEKRLSTSSTLSQRLGLTKPKKTVGQLSEAVKTRQMHVWSAGGDGTVMSVFELLVSNKVDLDLVFFSCIPFGTGNDFSQVLGWGRTIPEKNVLGSRLQNLENLISDRLEKSEAARLDIWQVKMTAYPGGYVREAGPKERQDGHDVAEVKELNHEDLMMVRKMSNYMSIGVQGFVGSGFEAHRAGNRLANMFVYAHESSKWVFWRRFPDLNWFIKDIKQSDTDVVYWTAPELQKSHGHEDEPEVTKEPIDLVIQNIPHIWGREVDLWGEAKYGLESVKNRAGPTDPTQWVPQRANDGRLEIMSIENLSSYLKKLANIRHHVSRIGQFQSPFSVNFKAPEEHKKAIDKLEEPTVLSKIKAFFKDLSRHKYEKKNIMCIMCDGEFYEIKNPKSIVFTRFAQIWTLGRNDEENQGRLVKDEIDSDQDKNSS